MSLLRASDLLQLQFQVSHPAIMHRTKMLVKRRGVFAVQRTKMNFDQILSVHKLVTLLSVWRNLNLILHHILGAFRVRLILIFHTEVVKTKS